MTLKPLIPDGPARKLYVLMNRKQRTAAGWMFLFMVIGMLLETLGLGFIVPALGLMVTPDVGAKYPFLTPALRFLGNPSQVHLVIIGMATVVLIYLIKSVFLIFLAWVQGRYIYGMLAEISQRLFTNYLRQSYSFHLRRNSSELVRNLTSEINIFSNAAQSVIMLCTEIMVMAGIIILLFAVEPLGSLAVCLTLGLAAWQFQRLVRSRVTRWSKIRQKHEGLRIQHLQQGLASIKDIKVLGREDDFLAQYRYHNFTYTSTNQRQFFVQLIPRVWLEFIAVCALAFVVFVMIWQHRPLDSLLPTMGLFGVAAFRLIPSANRSMIALQSARFARPVVDMLYHELVETGAPPPAIEGPPLVFRQKIAIEHLSFTYEGASRQSLSDINLEIPHGSCVGFVGGSGAGKSSLIDLILGVLFPTSGRVLIDGVNIINNLRGWQGHIGYVPQSIFLTDDTLERNIAFGLEDAKIDREAVWRALRYAQLDSFIHEQPLGLKTIVGERGVRLSGGQRQRIGIARALYHDPDVLILDEATSSLDIATESGVMVAIRAMQGHKTILIVAHRLSTVQSCDLVVKLEAGRIVQVARDLREIRA